MKIYRKIISSIDWLIVELISWRMRVSLKIEKAKRKDNLPISFPEVEKRKIQTLVKIAQQKKINPILIEEIFKAIMKESVRVQEVQRKDDKL